jgi:spoIIIJ-associated protein
LEWVETTGRTVDEAKRSALEQLGVEEADAEFEVVAEARIGLFGRLKEEARVRARLQPRYPRSKGERRDRRRARPTGEQRVRGVNPQSERNTSQRSASSRPTEEKGDQPEERAYQELSPATPRRRRRAHTNSSEEGANVGEMANAPVEEQARGAVEFLRGLLERFGTDGSVSSQVNEDGLIELSVAGEGLGILIGPKGSTLLALQELTRTVVQRHYTSSEHRIVVDVNGYRKRRHEALARFAKQVAQEVAATNVKRALEPMPPADRKVVHDAVNGIAGVTTVSEGEEPNRRVVLVPVAAQPSTSDEPTAEAPRETGTEREGQAGDVAEQKVGSQ